MSTADAKIAEQGLEPVGKRTEESKTQAPGYQAQGYAVAQSFIAELIGMGHTFNRYVGRLIELSTEAREFFLKELNKHVKDMRAHIPPEGHEEHIRYKKAAATANQQVTNMAAIVKALNAGWACECKLAQDSHIYLRNGAGDLQPLNPYTTNVADARLYLGAMGAKDGRGRPAKPWLDKLKSFILNNQPEFAGDVDGTVQLVQTLAQLTKKAQNQAPV